MQRRRRYGTGSACLCALLCGLSATVAAQEWTRFRGPNGTGASEATTIPVQWTPADYRWHVKLPGVGHSSPVVWGDQVFVLSADAVDATRYLLCIDAVSGRVRWQRSYPSATHLLHPRNTFASPTPAVDADQLYVAWATPDEVTLRALDHAGQDRWTRQLGPWVGQHGFGSSPIVYQQLVVLVNSQQAKDLNPGQQPGQSRVMAFDRLTGETRWTTPRTTTVVSYSTPCLYQPADGPAQLICCNMGDGIYSLDPLTGQPLWANPVFTMRTVASPLIVDDLVLASNGSGGFSSNYLTAVRAADGETVFDEIKRVGYVTTPIAYGELVFSYYDSGFVHCLEASSGKQHWFKRLTSGFSGSPVRVRDKLYCIDDEGTVIVLAADREFRELARNPLGERSRSTPAISGGRMFLRTESQLFCVGGVAR